MSSATTTLPVWAWILIALVLLGQAAWIYRDAALRGERKFLWGLFGLVNCPSSLIVYLLVTRAFARKATCPACAARIPADARFCPNCGARREATSLADNSGVTTTSSRNTSSNTF